MNNSSKKIVMTEAAVVLLQPFELAAVTDSAGYEGLSVSDYIRSRLGYRPRSGRSTRDHTIAQAALGRAVNPTFCRSVREST